MQYENKSFSVFMPSAGYWPFAPTPQEIKLYGQPVRLDESLQENEWAVLPDSDGYTFYVESYPLGGRWEDETPADRYLRLNRKWTNNPFWRNPFTADGK